MSDTTITPVDPVADLEQIWSWVQEERAAFWGMREHTKERVQAIYEHLDALDSHHAYLVRQGGRPVALFQTYWACEDEISEAYDARPGDLGIHLLLGPALAREEDWTGGLIRDLAAFVLQEPAMTRVLAEPDARNGKATGRAQRTGFALGPEVELPHKTAQLVFFDRADVEALLA